MTSQAIEIGRPAHHELSPHEIVLLLETDPKRGLSDGDAGTRLRLYGPNLLPPPRTAGPLHRLIRQLRDPLIYVLIAAGTVTLLLAEWVDSAVIFGVVVINAWVGFLQESKAQAALEALKAMVQTRARVVRGGDVRVVDSAGLVPGDLLRLDAGDKVPADLRLLTHSELRADESALTGESVPVLKDEDALPADTPVADRRNMLYSGTLLTHGSGTAVVVATGGETEIGEIHRLVGSAEPLATPLTRKLGQFSSVLTVVICALAIVTFLVGVARGERPAEMFTAAVALAVGAIPEGLPAAVTITLAIGVGRMARRRAVVRRLPAVETLGSTTVICTDKTGTLTENQMTVRRIWTSSATAEVTGYGYAISGQLLSPGGEPADVTGDQSLWWTLAIAARCNEARLSDDHGTRQVVGDPTEGALLVVAGKAGLDVERLRDRFPRTETLPFSSERGLMATRHRDEQAAGSIDFMKGAVERLLPLCAAQLSVRGCLQPLDTGRVLAEMDSLAGEGLRVLATAARWHDDAPALTSDLAASVKAGGWVFTGLVAMQDPARATASAAVATCRAAGIKVKMITGDHISTARSIARQVGILDAGDGSGVLSGRELAGLADDAAYADAVERTQVFARVSPAQKLGLVQALQGRGHVVAMTGDGVNDAPALRQADIGVAMGAAGTEVAKEAADVVLTDDDFSTIERAVEEGRGIFDNLTKFIVWTLPTNMAEGLVILVAILLGSVLPIQPVQILWINMTTAVALGLMLAFEPTEPGVMDRPPRDPSKPLLTGSLALRTLLVSALLVTGAWWLFEWERSAGASLAEARTVAINVFVTVEAFYLFSCRSLSRPIWSMRFFGNRWLLTGVAVQAAAQLALTYLPAMNALFHTAPIPVAAWLRIFAVAVAATAVVELDKRWRHRRRQGIS